MRAFSLIRVANALFSFQKKVVTRRRRALDGVRVANALFSFQEKVGTRRRRAPDGIDQMADSFNEKPSDVLHDYSTVPGLIAGQKGSEYAPYIEGFSAFIPGTLSGSNTKGFLDAMNPANYSTLGKTTNTVLGAVDAAMDTNSLWQGIVDTKKNLNN